MYPRESGYCGYRGYPAQIWRGVFFVRIIPAKHSSIIDQIPIFLPLGVQFFIGLWFFLADPRPPNFAEIHARGRRGRLEYDHRDLIPPLGA